MLKKAVAKNNPCIQSFYRELRLGVDKKSGKVTITVSDNTSGESIRDIPAEQVLRISRDLSKSVDLLFKPYN